MTREDVLGLVRKYGRNTTSFQVLEPGFQYAWFDDDACVAYVDTGSAWVAAGAPLTSTERIADVATAFIARAREAHRRPLFFATEERFASLVPSLVHLRVGEQPFWDPRRWTETLAGAKSLREQLRRARAKQVKVTRVEPSALAEGTAERAAVDELIARWLGMRVMPPMGFLVEVEPFEFATERRYYAARVGEQLVGFLALVPIFGRGGWFFEDLLRLPRAPNGTAESLFDAAMRDLAADEVEHATFGMAPLAGPVDRALRLARQLGKPLYDFEGLAAFKQKLRPTRWGAVHVSLPPNAWVPLAVYDVLRAFAGRRLVLFALATVLRGADVVVRVLTVLLVPWTALLATRSSDRWFAAPWIKWTWVGFDVLLTLLLFALSRRWRRGLATLLAALVTADATLTFLEAVTWNLPRAHDAAGYLVPLTAIFAPAFAAIVLWNARRRHALATG